MGGTGSTRWNSYQRKLTVDTCYQLRTSSILPRLRRGWSLERLDWPLQRILSGRCTLAGLRLTWTVDLRGVVNLTYGRQAQRLSFVCAQRWLWLCPRCDSRVAILYLPDEAQGWACRVCHNLTYASTQARRKPSKDPSGARAA